MFFFSDILVLCFCFISVRSVSATNTLHPFQYHTVTKLTINTNDNRDLNMPKCNSVFTKRLRKQRQEGDYCRRSFDNRSGYCVLSTRCEHAIREYRENGVPIDFCTCKKTIPVICCTLDTNNIEEQRISANKCQEYNINAQKINFNTLQSFSGKYCVSNVPLIYGGSMTRAGEYPHMAALGLSQKNQKVIWVSGGALISDRFILTAAHCIVTVRPNVARLGGHNFSDIKSIHEDIRIISFIVHPKYHPSVNYHDIALLKLNRIIQFSKTVSPACLWQSPRLDMFISVATGWGHTEFGQENSLVLRKVNLGIIDKSLCLKSYEAQRRLPYGIIDEQVCAGYMEGGKDTCQGDSGGPLHAELPEFNCVKFIIGITSFGKLCGSKNAPGVYTKVYPYLKWIEKIVFNQ